MADDATRVPMALPTMAVTPDDTVQEREPKHVLTGQARRKPNADAPLSYSTSDLIEHLNKPPVLEELMPTPDDTAKQMGFTANIVRDWHQSEARDAVGKSLADELQERAARVFAPNERLFDPD